MLVNVNGNSADAPVMTISDGNDETLRLRITTDDHTIAVTLDGSEVVALMDDLARMVRRKGW